MNAVINGKHGGPVISVRWLRLGEGQALTGCASATLLFEGPSQLVVTVKTTVTTPSKSDRPERTRRREQKGEAGQTQAQKVVLRPA